MSAASPRPWMKSREMSPTARPSSQSCGTLSIRSISTVFLSSSTRSGGTMPPKEGGGVVLVVDDSPDTLRMLTDALEDAGMTVLVALEGKQALAIGEKITPD